MWNDSEQIRALMKDWGYYPLPHTTPDRPGYAGLLVALRRRPTGQHYDPQKVTVHLREPMGEIQTYTLNWLLPSSLPQHVCPGPIVLYDLHDKRVHFFTFGATLEMIPDPEEQAIIYGFRSSAPIFEQSEQGETFANHLIAEAEVTLGKLKAQLELKMRELEEEGKIQERRPRSQLIDPTAFYLATLYNIARRYEQSPALRQMYPHFYHAIEVEKTWWMDHDQWPLTPPSLRDIFPQCLINA